MTAVLPRVSSFIIVGLATLAAAPGCTKRDTPPAAQPQPQPAVQTVKTDTGEMARVPGGTFTMGSAEGEEDERPPHEVKVNAFLIDTCEVTQKQFQALMDRNPSHFKQEDNPVEQVSWADAAFYCNARSKAEGLTPCYDEETGACDFSASGYRLPTEAEWEYACRAGSEEAYAFGNDAAKLSQYAWFKDSSAGKPHPAGQRRPNAWGIHDMHGNLLEWCNDVYAEGYYAQSPAANPQGPPDEPGALFVLRGGAWDTSADSCRSAFRSGDTPGQVDGCFRRDEIGFRCVRNAPAEGAPAPKTAAE